MDHNATPIIHPERPLCHLLIGPTASGKSAVGLILAERMQAEIVSMDSMRVYRGMDIGTAKPTAEECKQVVHHLIDILDISENYSVALFARHAEQLMARGRPILFEGGTALYVKALTEGLFEGPPADDAFRARLRQQAEEQGVKVLYDQMAYVDPESARRIDRNDLRRIIRALEVHHATGTTISHLQQEWKRGRRPEVAWKIAGIRRQREDLYRRSNRRVKDMLEAGLEDEIRDLLRSSRPWSLAASQALGYKEFRGYIEGEYDRDRAVELTQRRTRNFIKNQLTWYRKWHDVFWVDVAEDEPPQQAADTIWEKWSSAL